MSSFTVNGELPNVHVSNHPLISHKMTLLRDVKTQAHEFRRILKEITFFLGYDATRSLSSKHVTVTTPMDVDFEGTKVADSVAIIPVLRSGLAMADGMLELLPTAAVHHIGMYRAKESLLPVQYYNRLPRDAACDIAYIVDPCIATSNTLNAICSIVKKWGAKRIVVIAAVASRDGIVKISEKHPDVEIHVAAIDNILSEDGMIIPGIGDSGDRAFGTPIDGECKKRKA